MADTSYLRYHVEPWIREQLMVQFNMPFSSKTLELKTRGHREFDAVSEDQSVVASIKAHSGATSSGKNPSAKVSSALLEVYFLMLVPAKERILILTNPEFFEIFTRNTKGRIVDDVSVQCLPLPSDMQAKVAAVTKRASDEMRFKSGGK